MLEHDVRKPVSTEEFVKILTEAAEKECRARSLLKGKPTKPTISGTAKILNAVSYTHLTLPTKA